MASFLQKNSREETLKPEYMRIPGENNHKGRWETVMKTTTTGTRTGSAAQSNVRVDDQLYKVGAGVVGIASCAIGIWAVVSLGAGMIASGGPVGLVLNWLSAVSGKLF
jgi:hypothetical protein